MKKLNILMVLMLMSVLVLTGCQPKEEKVLQGTWQNSIGGMYLTFDRGTVQTKFVDGSDSEDEYKIKKLKKDREFAIITTSEDPNGKMIDTEMQYKISKDGKTLWVLHTDNYYDKVEEPKD